VADVFVDNGKALRDGHDQRGTVRVVQKPTPYAPVRYPSVVQDWARASLEYDRIKEKLKTKPPIPKFSTIEEEPRKDSLTESFVSERTTSDNLSNVDTPYRDVPVRSVERDEPAAVPPSPPRWVRESPVLVQDSQDNERLESKELGDSPSPVPPPMKRVSPVQEEDTIIKDVEPVLPEPVPERAHKAASLPSQPEPKKAEPVRKAVSEPSPKAVSPANQTQDVEMTDVEPTSQAASKNVSKNQREPSPAVLILKDKVLAAANRKRKKSSEILAPKKGPRLDLSTAPPSRPQGKSPVTDPEPQSVATSPLRKRERAPSFSSPQRRPSISERPADPSKPGLGLGITKSPQRKKTVMLNLTQDGDRPNESQPVHTTPLFPRSTLSDRRSSTTRLNDNTPSKVMTPVVEQTKKLTSALRKDSSIERSEQRRSVSFAEGTEIVTPTAAAASRSSLKPGIKLPIATPTSSAEKPQWSGSVVWPPGVSQEKLQQIQSEVEQKMIKHGEEKAEWERKIAAAEKHGTDPEYLDLLRDSFACWSELREIEKTARGRARIRSLTEQMRTNAKRIQEKEDELSSQKTAKQKKSPKTNGEKSSSSKTSSSTKVSDGKSGTKSGDEKTTPKAKAVEPPSKVLQKTAENDDIPPSSILSDDNNLPPTHKIRAVQEEKNSPAPPRAKSTATRSITKIATTQNGESGSASKSASRSQSESGSSGAEKAAEEKASEKEASEDQFVDDSNDGGAGPQVQVEVEISKAEMLQQHRSPSAARAGSKPLSEASAKQTEPATKQTQPPAKKDVADKEASSSSSSESDDSESESESEDSEAEGGLWPKLPKHLSLSSPLERKKSPAAGKSSLSSSFNFKSGWTPVNGDNSPGPLPSSQPKSQSQPQLSNGVSSRPDLKSLKALMEESTQEAKKKAQQKQLPEGSNRAARPGRKSIFDPPSDSDDSDDSESESESSGEEDASTDNSDDDSRGDILPTGKAQKMRKTKHKRMITRLGL
jgi:hypothetical protein